MLFMVIERFKNTDEIGRRFRALGRMLPAGVEYRDSWVQPDGARCFQLMEAPNAAALQPWMERWQDLMEFKIAPVLGSTDFWTQRT